MNKVQDFGLWRKKEDKTWRIARNKIQNCLMKEKEGYVKKYGLLIASDTIKLKKNED